MAEHQYSKIQIVDENDNFIANVSYEEALAKKAIRRAARIFIINESGQILIQRRSEHVAKPLLLDNSVGGHVDEGETYREAALREMKEELGLEAYELIEIANSFRSGGFFCNLYLVKVPDGIEVTFDEYEVSEVLWLSREEVTDLVTHNVQECTHSLIHMWNEFSDKMV